MPIRTSLIMPTTALLIVGFVLAATGSVFGQAKFKILHGFGSGTDGGGIWGSVTFDSKGNLYGGTSGGGAYEAGTVYELTPGAAGQWSESALYSFMADDPYGEGVFGSVVLDDAGNIYGTAEGGGTYAYGTVFELTPDGSGGLTASALYSFGAPGTDCGSPYFGLVMDPSGNLFGAAACVFELTPISGGWTESELCPFSQGCGSAGVTLDRYGNLYGAGDSGGAYGHGIVFELTPGSGGWTETVLHSFGAFPNDGLGSSLGQLALDISGNLYGTTFSGGANGSGTVYEMVRQPHGGWKEAILYSFQQGATGWEPGGEVAVDRAGNIYGTTINGGSPVCGCGVVFELSKGTGGVWTYTVLHTFQGSDGAQPDANVTLHGGKVYGTTATGGPYGGGVVYEIIP